MGRFFWNGDHGVSNAESGVWVGVSYAVSNAAGTKHVDLNGNGSTYSGLMSDGNITNNFGLGDRWVYLAARGEDNILHTDLFFMAVRRSGANAAYVTWRRQTGVVRLWRGDGTLLGTSAAVAFVSNWYYWWLDFDCKNSGGTLSVYLSGNTTPIVTATGDTTSAATDGWDQLAWSGENQAYYDDIITYSAAEKAAFANGVYPELFASNVAVTSDATNTFVSGGFASVDETPWSSVDYAESTTAGQELICNVTGLAWTPAVVRAVVVQSYYGRDGVINQSGGLFTSGAATITVKQSCNLATNAALPSYVAAGAGPGKTLTGTALGILTVDSVNVVLNNRVLVKDEGGGTSVNNGIYKCTTEGTAGAIFVLTRSTDFDNVGPDGEVDTGDVTCILAGSANINKTFRLTTADPITVDTTPLTFVEYTNAYLPSKTGAASGVYSVGQWIFALNPNGDIPWTYAAAIAAKPGLQTQTAL